MSSSDRSRDIYLGRVNRGIDMIMRGFGDELKLERVAAEAGFSPFHFHRIFKATTGFTVVEFVTRVRLDRARTLMWQRPDLLLTDVALECGFGSSSNFSRVFKKRFGMSPSAFNAESYQSDTKEERATPYREPRSVSGDPSRFQVMTVTVNRRLVAYLRITDPYEPGRISDAARDLEDWLRTSSLSAGGWIGYTWDHPDFVAAENCAYCLGVEVEPSTIPEAPIQILDLPAMTVAEITLGNGMAEEVQAIDWLYQTWLPGSGFQPTGYPIFETWERHSPGEGDDGNLLTIALPVIRL